MKEISTKTMKEWSEKGTITITSVGSENVYFADSFGIEFFCKCYPQHKIVVSMDDGSHYTFNDNL
jgi:hypothetical protein